MKRIFIVIILLSSLFLHAKTWIREYTYQASEADSKITSRSIALEQVKRLLLQEIGVYVHSTVLSGEFEASGEVKDLSEKQIEIISAGITETKILEENWNGETYYIKAEITADENDVIKRLDRVIEDKEKTKQLEESRQRSDKALAEIDCLKQQLTQTLNENEKLKIQKDYNQSSNQLTAEDWFQKGYNADEICEYDNAILYYQKAIEIKPDFIEAYHNMGCAYCNKGNYDKAIECFQKAIEIKPDFAEAYLNMGVTYRNKGNYDKAIECYQNSIRINPNNAKAYTNMGIVYGNKGNYNKEIEYYQKSIELFPYSKTYFNMGLAYYDIGKYNDAIQCYENAIKLDPNNGDAYFNLGNVYLEIREEINAIMNFKKTIEINPYDEVAYYNIGNAYNDLGYYDKAITYFQKAIELKPDYAEAYNNIGFSYVKKGNFEKSIEYTQKAARLGYKGAQYLLKEFGIPW
ncbi:MAG: tetratricopeptide repeat protein [Candidatus Cloacimonadales bacterium]|nr:tetratricopeptide repeat protein [Candidatus Cloacimonadales bacterium]